MADITTGYTASGVTATGPVDWYTSGSSVSWPSDNTVKWEHTPVVAVPTAKGEYVFPGPGTPWGTLDVVHHHEIDKAYHELGDDMIKNMAEHIDRAIMGTNPKEDKMPKNSERTVFNVFVIDPEGDGKVVATLNNVIAKDSEAAKLKAVYELSSAENQERLEKDLEDYDLLVEDVADFGSIRPKKE